MGLRDLIAQRGALHLQGVGFGSAWGRGRAIVPGRGWFIWWMQRWEKTVPIAF